MTAGPSGWYGPLNAACPRARTLLGPARALETSVPKLLEVVAQLETGSWMLPLTTRCHQSGLSRVLREPFGVSGGAAESGTEIPTRELVLGTAGCPQVSNGSGCSFPRDCLLCSLLSTGEKKGHIYGVGLW